MQEIDPGKVLKALERIGQDEVLRSRLIEFCREVESRIQLENRSVRDEITGPVLDAVHAGVGTLRKRVKPGLVFDFQYTSKISRELVMSPETEPEHVWEPQTTKTLLHFSRGARHVIIGGAYFGDQAVLVARNIQKQGGVCHAFELNPELFAMLKVNAKNNSLDNMRLNNCGLWSDDKSQLVLVGKDDTLAYSQAVSADSQRQKSLSTVSLNTYGREQKIDELGLVMLDIEGGELEVFKGADHYLSMPAGQAPVLVFEVHRNYCDWTNGLESTPIARFLKGFGYHLFAVRDYQAHVPMENRPVELIPAANVVLEGPPHGFNMLGIKDLKLVENDLFRQCRDVSPKLLKHKDPALHHPKH
jgi:FkbM family methyltransferase